MFQPDLKYALSPYMSPVATAYTLAKEYWLEDAMLGSENSPTFKNISTVKTTVKMLLRMLSIFLSVDQGGMLGLSMASVMQLAAMKMRTMKSNQFLLVRSSHCIRNLHRTVGGASLRVKAKEEEEEVDVVVKRRARERGEESEREKEYRYSV